VNLELHRKKLSAAIVLATLMLSALFLARGATSLVAGSFLPVSAAPPVKVSAAKAERPPGSEPPDAHSILARNIFDPTTGSLWPPKPVEAPVDTTAELPPEPRELQPGEIPPPCEGGTLKLVASVYSDKYPDWSFATLSNGTAAPLLYRQGGRLDDKEVVAIYPKAVFFRQANNSFCSLALFAPPQGFAPKPGMQQPTMPVPPAPIAGAAMPPGMPPPMTPGGISEDELNQNISAVSETKFSVQRSFVDKILQNQAEIMRSARIVPHEENGQVVGVKLYGIRRNSLLGKLGLQNGDLLRTINGFDMASPDSALEAYSRLRSASNLSVAVTRRGRPMNVDYDIVGGQ
jgi:general secretion pathway protein C